LLRMRCPLLVLHYKKNLDRKEHLRRSLEGTFVDLIYIEEEDQGEFALDDVYRFDERAYQSIIMSIKDNIIGTAWGLDNPSLRQVPWANCINLALQKRFTVDQTFKLFPFLRPAPLKPYEVSLFLKHRIAWKKIVEGDQDFAIIAEDDLIVHKHSLSYLSKLLTILPHDFDYIDIAGGLSLSPRVGNRLVNEYFFEIDPPRPRTTCCAIVRKSFADRLLKIDPPIVVGVDWMLINLFNITRSKVYWVEPLVFGHGSQMGTYKSSARPQ
jgi:hypothetical protein